jgi:hypothetical protein
MIILDIRELERRLIERKRALGIAGRLTPNPGARRTDSKRQLLRAIAEGAPEQRRALRPT